MANVNIKEVSDFDSSCHWIGIGDGGADFSLFESRCLIQIFLAISLSQSQKSGTAQRAPINQVLNRQIHIYIQLHSLALE